MTLWIFFFIAAISSSASSSRLSCFATVSPSGADLTSCAIRPMFSLSRCQNANSRRIVSTSSCSASIALPSGLVNCTSAWTRSRIASTSSSVVPPAASSSSSRNIAADTPPPTPPVEPPVG